MISHLFLKSEASEKESHSQDQQQVCQNRSEKRCLHDTKFILEMVSRIKYACMHVHTLTKAMILESIST